MKLRPYRDADEPSVLALWEETGIGRPWLDLQAEIHEKRKRDRSLFLVAEEDGKIHGAVMGAYDGRRGWVYHLATDSKLQGQGIGRALMEELERRMARLGVAKVNLQVRADNPGVIGFYERLGYADERLTSFGKWLGPCGPEESISATNGQDPSLAVRQRPAGGSRSNSLGRRG